MALRTNVNARRIALLLWVLVACFYFYLSYDYIRITMDDRKFADYMQYVVQLAGTEGRPAKEIRALLLVKADQLSLPVHGEQIMVRAGNGSVDVAVNYDVDIEIPLIQREIYTEKFEHKARYQGPR
jgi:hypothetical protein